jgi:glutamate formiminotransferase/formiminotetrahydrofolate cyclodeaminase
MGAMAAGLVCMVARITLGRKESPKNPDLLNDVIVTGEQLREKLLKLVADDAEAFNEVMKAFKIPKEQGDVRKKTIQDATIKAADVPLATMENSVQVLRLALKIAQYGAVNTLSDTTTAVAAGLAAVEGGASNVLINLKNLDDEEYRSRMQSRVESFKSEARTLKLETNELIDIRMGEK